MQGTTKYERMFVDLYVDYFLAKEEAFSIESSIGDRKIQTGAWTVGLLPIPQIQIYCEAPLDSRYPPEPSNSFRIDFGFWTGERNVAVEIDGYEPSGYERDLRRDRTLRRAAIDIVHILNSELEEDGSEALRKLLPRDVLISP